MARTAAWRGDLTWVCANENWRQAASYGLTSKTPLQGWAWEFLRRNASYRAAVDLGDDGSAEKWGLVALADYRQAFVHIEEPSRPKWLALQSFEMFLGPRQLPSLADSQLALIFDLRRTLRKDVLQRQLAKFVEHLYQPTGITWHGVSAPRKHGGRNYNLNSLLTYLRFADAVAQDRNIDLETLKKSLGYTSERAGKQLHEAYVKASSLVGKDYSRLVDLDLAPLKSIPAALRRKKSAPLANKVSWD
jgi:hypothetical protein